MKVEVRPLNVLGKPQRKKDVDKTPPCRGKLKVFENRLHTFGRSLLCAQVVDVNDGLEAQLLPELSNAELLWLDNDRMRLSGLERVDTMTFYQTWDVRVV